MQPTVAVAPPMSKLGAALVELARPGSAPAAKKLAAASKLRSALGTTEGAAQARASPGSVLDVLGRLLHGTDAVRAQVPPLFGSLGAVLSPNLGPLLDWVVALGGATGSALYPQMIELLAGLSPEQMVASLRPRFVPIVDLLLGWALDPSSPAAACRQLANALCRFETLWKAAEPFGSSVVATLARDIQGEAHRVSAAAEAAADASAANGAAGAGKLSLVAARRLERLSEAYGALAFGLGRDLFLGAARGADLTFAVLGGLLEAGAWLCPASEARQGAALPAADAASFVAAASDCVFMLADTLRTAFAPHHANGAALLLLHLRTAASGGNSSVEALPSGSVAHTLGLLNRLMLAQGAALPTAAPRHFLGGAEVARGVPSPLPALRLRSEPAVLSKLLAAHRHILLHASAPVSAALHQGLLAEVRVLVAKLGPIDAGASGSGGGGGVSGGGNGGGGDAAVGASSGAAGGGASADWCQCGSGDVVRHLLFHMSLAALLHSETSHAAPLLSGCDALLRAAHPTRAPAVVRRRGLRHASLAALLAPVWNKALQLPAPRLQSSKPAHAALATLAASLRRLLLEVLSAVADAESLEAARAARGDNLSAVRLARAQPLASDIAGDGGGASREQGLADVSSLATPAEAVLSLRALAAALEAAAAPPSSSDASTVSFSHWLGSELLDHPPAAILGALLPSLHSAAAPVRAAGFDAAAALLRSSPPGQLVPPLGAALDCALAQLHAADAACRAAAAALLVAAAPATLAASVPAAAKPRVTSSSSLLAGSALATATGAGKALAAHSKRSLVQRWAHAAASSDSTLPVLSPATLELALRSLSGREPPQAAAAARLLFCCAARRPDPSPLTGPAMALAVTPPAPPPLAVLRPLPTLGSWCAVLELINV